jgi:tetratricopeptide (TPR) repeat protein
MLYCSITIDYLSQLERTSTQEATSFMDELLGIASAFGGVIRARRTPLIIGYTSEGIFDGIQTAEALRQSVGVIEKYRKHLRGVALVVHNTNSAEAAIAFSTSIRYRDHREYSCTFSPEAMAGLSRYFDFRAGGEEWVEPVFNAMLATADAARLFERPRLAETMAKALAKLGRDGPRLVHLDAGKGTRSIETLAVAIGLPADTHLVLAGIKTRPLPFSPLLEAVAAFMKAMPDASAPRDADEAAFSFVSSSAFSGGAPDSVSKGCALYLNRWLDRFGKNGGILLCDSPEQFSTEATELLSTRLVNTRGGERIVSVSDGPLLESLTGAWAARVASGLADTDNWSQATEAALGTTAGPIREALTERFEAIANKTSAAGTDRLLDMLPQEAIMYLYGLAIAENELSAGEFSEFLGGFGLKTEGEALLKKLLSHTGLVEPYDGRSPVQPIDRSALLLAIGHEVAESMERGLSEFLVRLYRTGRIKPSLGFLQRVGERQDDERLLYDCLFDEVLRPDSPKAVNPSFLSPSSMSVFRFWSALMACDRPASEAVAAIAEERISGLRAKAVKALVRSELAYATGDAERASKGAREALLALGTGAPPKLEARSQRMMGLAALAMDKHTEAVDYLTNAQELSESAHDEYERMMAAYAKAVVEFMSGALVKSLKAAQCAEESATRLFRVDMKVAIEALRGRIDLELGSYDEAARRFNALAEIAERYSIHDAVQRASVWRARALAYAGEYLEAASLLEAEPSDAEARVFRGELEILRGRPHDARPWLDTPADPMVRPFGPPDSFEWSSLFSEIEGRCIGFDSADAPLAELRNALNLFAKGLDERDPACAVDLHALTRTERASKINPGMGTYSFFCYLLEERLANPPVDKQTVLSRAFKTLQQRAGRIEDRAQRALYMEKNAWNKRLLEAARTHKFI